MKKAALFVICLVLLTGCWDRTELKQLGIVLGMAIDKDADTGEYIFTSQMLRPSASGTGGPSPSTESPVEKVETTGKTIFEAIRKTNQEFDRKGFFAHNKVILISEELAKEGLLPILDAFQRGKEIRGYVFICITKNAKARQILETKTGGIEPIPAVRIRDMLENTAFQFNTVKINLLNFYIQSMGNGMEPVVGVLEFEKDKSGNKHIKLSGGAVFNKDKLVGYLNEQETRGYRWVKGDVESGTLTLPSPVDKKRFDTVEVKKANAEIKPEISGGDISFSIRITGVGTVAEEESTTSLESNAKVLDHMKKLEKDANQQIKEDIKTAVDKAQKEFQSDIFGFGRALNKKDPKTWNRVKKDWNERFADVPYTVSVSFSIKSTGLLRGPSQAQY